MVNNNIQEISLKLGENQAKAKSAKTSGAPGDFMDVLKQVDKTSKETPLEKAAKTKETSKLNEEKATTEVQDKKFAEIEKNHPPKKSKDIKQGEETTIEKAQPKDEVELEDDEKVAKDKVEVNLQQPQQVFEEFLVSFTHTTFNFSETSIPQQNGMQNGIGLRVDYQTTQGFFLGFQQTNSAQSAKNAELFQNFLGTTQNTQPNANGQNSLLTEVMNIIDDIKGRLNPTIDAAAAKGFEFANAVGVKKDSFLFKPGNHQKVEFSFLQNTPFQKQFSEFAQSFLTTLKTFDQVPDFATPQLTIQKPVALDQFMPELNIMGKETGESLITTTKANILGQNAPKQILQQNPAEQIRVQVAKSIQKGIQNIKIQLKPAHLGNVNVKLDFQADGMVKTLITVEKQETLETLMRDVKSLEQALKDAGLKTSADNMEFKYQNPKQNEFEQQNSPNFMTLEQAEESEEFIEVQNTLENYQIQLAFLEPGKLDLQI